MPMQLLGIDHVTAITASREDCLDFYSGLLGVDSTVMRFVDSPGAPAGTPGPGMVHTVRWWVPGRWALEQWAVRLDLGGGAAAVNHDAAGDPVAVRFADPEGLAHELLPRPAAERPRRLEGRPVAGLPPALKLAGVRAFVAGSVQSFDLLAGRLGFTAVSEGEWRVGSARYACDAPPSSRPFQGAGTIHHVAWRCAPGQERACRPQALAVGAPGGRLS